MLQCDQVSSPNNMILFMSAKRMLSKGCPGFLEFVRHVDILVTELESVHIVSELPDVFPEELSGLPYVREIDFGVDIALEDNLYQYLHI